jgi:hypothetical protein
MNTALWTAQVLWGVFFSLSGFGKILCYNPALWNQALREVPWFSAVPQDLFIFIGACEFLGGIILAAVFHIARGEYNFLPINLALGGVAAFIAYGRVCVSPSRPRRSVPSAH